MSFTYSTHIKCHQTNRMIQQTHENRKWQDESLASDVIMLSLNMEDPLASLLQNTVQVNNH